MSAVSVDLAVIGAGPAGMAAATEAAKAGLSVVVLDEQPRPGGQIYRGIETVTPKREAILGADYSAGRSLAEAFRASSAAYRAGASVWNIGTDLMIDVSQEGTSSQIRPRAILSATGALERPMPMRGWTLPGVTTIGALQILLKSAGVVQPDAVLAGSGPLLWLLAQQMVAAGCPPKAVVENIPKGRMLSAAKHLPKALKARTYLTKGLRLMQAVRAAGVPIYRHAQDLAIMGSGAAEALEFTSGGKSHRIDSGTIALHQGVVPNQQITRLLRAAHHWDASQHCFRPTLDAAGQTSVAGLYVAGDGAGIAGAASAALQGRLVALEIARSLGREVKGGRLTRLRAALERDGAVRPLLETLYAPAPEVLAPADDVLLCRCEEVTAGSVRETVRLGAPGPNQVKSLLRTGMGPCQGRICGLAVAGVIAATKGESPSVTDYYRIRPPLKPLQLSELAGFAPEPDTPEVVR
ncbi:(2Fe-2S)-binding protein (plasmid) [Thioclava sp. 'Guangxiensis']|uniref:(2Fe-2S)-binding protein n=1 Tax=Thioclava sp. 'Guangxiensis' TaxID=3149044 RepID=UPI0032C44056